MSYLNFGILAFSNNFCPIKTDLPGNTVWPQASGFQKLAKMDHFWLFKSTFVHSKCKRSSLHSQCWLRLFLWFSDIVIWSSIFTTVFMLGWWNFALTDLLVCVFSWQTKHPNKPRRHGFLKWKEEVKALLAWLLYAYMLNASVWVIFRCNGPWKTFE